MIRLFLAALLIALMGSAASWLADQPGEVSLLWRGWRVDTSAAFLALIAAMLGVAAWMAAGTLRALLRAPSRLKRAHEERKNTKALEAATKALVALAANRPADAIKAQRRVEQLLGSSPLSLLLKAQAARQAGDEAEAHAAMEAMLAYPQTGFLAARSLSEFHARKEEDAKALSYAAQAEAHDPRSLEAARLKAGAHVRLKEWEEALHVVARARGLSRSARRRLKGAVYHAQAEAIRHEGRRDLAERVDAVARKYLKRMPQGVEEWQCNVCGFVDGKWHALCPRCHSFDSMDDSALLRA